jgi:hypothetical protein
MPYQRSYWRSPHGGTKTTNEIAMLEFPERIDAAVDGFLARVSDHGAA